MLIFTDTLPLNLKVYGLYTGENVDIYGCRLAFFAKHLKYDHLNKVSLFIGHNV